MQNSEELKNDNNLGEEHVAVDGCCMRDGSEPGDAVPRAGAADNNGQILLVRNTFAGEEVPRGGHRSHSYASRAIYPMQTAVSAVQGTSSLLM